MGNETNNNSVINPDVVLLSICKQFNALQITVQQLCEAYSNKIIELNKQIEELNKK